MEAQAKAQSTPPPSLRKFLEKCVSDDTILDCNMSAGSNPGDNVVGKMVSVRITTSSGNQHDLVVKASVPFRHDGSLSDEEKLFSKVVAAFGFFQTELSFYQRIQPKLQDLQNHGFELPVPRIYFGQTDEENGGLGACLILEDLRPQGFKMADKMKGLSKEEVIMVLDKLARFHATSYVYLQKGQVNVQDQDDPLATHIFEKSDPIGALESHQNFCRDLCNGMYEWGPETGAISEELYHKISKFTDDPRSVILTTSRQAREDYFPVVIHGDLWVNNILFKYDGNGKPVDVSFIDFQQCRYSSVFDELHYFLYTSTTAEFRKKNLAECLSFYHERFHETVKILHGKDKKEDKIMQEFTREAFLQGYRKYLGAAFCYGVIAIPFQLGIAPDPEEVGEAKDKIPESGAKDQISKQSDDQELKEFIGVTFQGMGTGLIAAARNSPVALQRFAEFCGEMDRLGVF